MYKFNKSTLHVKTFQLAPSPPSVTSVVKSNLTTDSTKLIPKGGNESNCSRCGLNSSQSCDNKRVLHTDYNQKGGACVSDGTSHVNFNILPTPDTLQQNGCGGNVGTSITSECGCKCKPKPVPETKCNCNNECSPITVSDLLNAWSACDHPDFQKTLGLILSDFSNLPAKYFISRWSTPYMFKPHCYGMTHVATTDSTHLQANTDSTHLQANTDSTHLQANTDSTQITGVSADSQTLCLRTIITCPSHPHQWELFPFGDWATPTPIDTCNSVRVYVYAPLTESTTSCNKGDDDSGVGKHNHHAHVPTAVSCTYTPYVTSSNLVPCDPPVNSDSTCETNNTNSESCNEPDDSSCKPPPQCGKCNSQTCTCTVTINITVCQSCKQPKDKCTCVPQRAYKLYVCCAKWECRNLGDSKCGRPSCTYVLCLDSKSVCEYDCDNKETPFASGLDGLQSHLIFYVNNETVKLL
jgi:hypothetical protein